MYLVFVFALTYASVAAIPTNPSSDCHTINNNYYGWEQKGTHGPIPPHAIPGKRGATGSKGSTGERGHKGDRGMRGFLGYQGHPGIKGATGIGQKGEKGETSSNLVEEVDDLKRKYEEIVALCHRVQHPRTCADIHVQDVAMESGYYLISPNPSVLKPFYVYCNVTPTAAYTTFGHDNEKEKSVPECEAIKCYSQHITYDDNMEQIRQVVLQSQSCRQYLKYRCQGSVINWPNGPRASWSSYNGEERHHWGGSAQDYSCACGDTETCVDQTKKCNCDQNSESLLTSDEGYLNDKNYLPVTNLKFGDLGGANEHGWHTLGKLECFGTVN